MFRHIRQSIRSLARSPGFTLAAVLCLGLAIGANTAIFTVLNAVLLKPLSYAEPSRLVMLWERFARNPEGHNVVAPADFLDWRGQTRSFSGMAALAEGHETLTGLGEAQQVPMQAVTASLFPVLGVTPALGRTFTEDEDTPAGPAVVVVSDRFWRRHLSADPRALGQSITLGGTPFTVIGVMPPGFRFKGRATDEAELWTPLSLDPSRDYRATSGRYLLSVGRLKPGVTVDQADAELRALAARLAQEHPVFNAGWTTTIVPLREQVVGGARTPLLVLAGVVAFVLLIACANVANLQLARGAARRRELAVRTALGASRGTLVRDLLVESLVLSVAGGALGLMLAVWGTAALVAVAPAGLPRLAEISVDTRTLGFTAVLSILTGFVFGLLPALHGSRADLNDVIKEGGRGVAGGRLRSGLVAAQLALSLVLLVGAGLLIRSFLRLSREDPGFDATHVLAAKVDLPTNRYNTDPRQAAFFEELLARIRRLPGVTSASAINWLPFGGNGSASDYFVEGRPAPPPGQELGADIRAVDPDYFRTLGIPVRAGELFTSRDGPNVRKAVVINQALARQVFPNENPIGRHILMPWGDTLNGEIVAVVGDTRHAGLDSLPHPTLYWPMAQFPWSFMSLVIRTPGEPERLTKPVAGELHALDPDVPLADPRPLDAFLSQSVASQRFTMLLLGAFAAVAVMLAAIGISAVVANAVVRRTREIGVRMALGAGRRDVLGMVLRQGMLLVGIGLVAGLAGSLALTRVLRSLLYGVSPTDLVTFAGVPLLLAGIALVAAYLPARRAAQVDPMVALRSE